MGRRDHIPAPTKGVRIEGVPGSEGIEGVSKRVTATTCHWDVLLNNSPPPPASPAFVPNDDSPHNDITETKCSRSLKRSSNLASLSADESAASMPVKGGRGGDGDASAGRRGRASRLRGALLTRAPRPSPPSHK